MGAPNLQTNDSKSVQLYYYDDATDTWIPVSINNPMPVDATFTGSITIGAVSQGSPNTLVNAWPVKITDGTNVLGTGSNPLNVALPGAVTVTQPIGSNLHVVIDSSAAVTFTNPVTEFDSTPFDLMNGPFTFSPSIPKDYRLDSIRILFLSSQIKTITISDLSGLILWGGALDASYKNLGYNTLATDFNLISNQEFKANDDITIGITQTLFTCIVNCKINVTYLT